MHSASTLYRRNGAWNRLNSPWGRRAKGKNRARRVRPHVASVIWSNNSRVPSNVSKTALIGLVGAVLLIAALGLNYWLNREVGQEVAQNEAAQEPSAATPDGAPPAENEATTPTATDGDIKPTVVIRDNASGSPDAPSFDVVRLSPDGDSVFAGRAPAGSTVTILLDGDVLGTVEADERGEWVFLPDRPLSPGSHELALRATMPAASDEATNVAAAGSADEQAAQSTGAAPDAQAVQSTIAAASPEPDRTEPSDPATTTAQDALDTVDDTAQAARRTIEFPLNR